MDDKATTRDRILQAAITRIKHYGYAKTTMAEIAADCDMSPGNIYRFFEAKIDLAEAMARKHYAEEHTAMAQVGRRKDWAPDKRLKEMLLKRMRENYQMFEDHAKILEVAEVLSRERPLFMNELIALERVSIAAVIEEGMQSGLFAKGDAEFAAEMLQAATVKFSIPQLISRLTLPKLERELEGVMTLLLCGLYATEHKDSAKKGRTRQEAEA
ncbi:MAG: TetR/AcrR family transcriptional regulator [Hyphomonadaceae bacterium]|nr:TetR/AcrR family transcriptional regulator [Hyphomonadaceae bacterium]MBX3511588.1 TetR/AcrR family transcriptional regulator [Hyphomonadaceae bacterium]